MMTNSGREGATGVRGIALLLFLAGCINGTSDSEGGRTGRPFGIVAKDTATLLTIVDSTLQWNPRFTEYGVHLAVVDSQLQLSLDTLPEPIVKGRIEGHDRLEDTRTVSLVIKSRMWADMVELQLVSEEDGAVKGPPRITMVNDVPAVGTDVAVAEIWRDRTGPDGDTVRVKLARCEPLRVRVIEHALGPVELSSSGGAFADSAVGPFELPPDSPAEETRKGFRLMTRSEFTFDSVPNCCP